MPGGRPLVRRAGGCPRPAPMNRIGSEFIHAGIRHPDNPRKTACWTIWNNGGKVPYCCPEPQSWTTNAPNMPDPEAEGFRSIATGGTWSMKFRLYAK